MWGVVGSCSEDAFSMPARTLWSCTKVILSRYQPPCYDLSLPLPGKG